MEVWKDIPGFEGIYQVSTKGRVNSVGRDIKMKDGTVKFLNGKIMSNVISGSRENNKYYRIGLWKDSKYRRYLVHRLVAETFIINTESKNQVNHKDGNKLNNSVENLEWVTQSENQRHAIDNGFKRFPKGINHQNSTPVNCYDIHGNLIKKYNMIREAVEDGFSDSCISMVLSGRNKSHKGFIFKYA